VDLVKLLEQRADRFLPIERSVRVGRRRCHNQTTSSTPTDHLLASAKRRQSDTERAVAVPVVQDGYFDDALEEIERLHRPGATMRLRPIQSLALAVLKTCRGLLGSIGVGHGKTLVAILGAKVVGAKRPVVMVPPSLRETFFVEFDKFSTSFDLPRVELLAYSMLSRPEGTDLLRRMAPDYIFADEAHSLRHPGSARTRRLLRYLEENPSTVFAAASGTLTSRSLRDYAHLSRHALGEGSPLPLLESHLDSWCNAIDVDGRPSPTDWATVEPLVDAFGEGPLAFMTGAARVEAVREAFLARLESAPGVVITEDESAPCSLVIHTLRTPRPPGDIIEAIAVVRSGESPNREEVYEDDVAVWRAARQVSAGFFYRWDWPDGIVDDQWLEARSRWSRWVRRELETGSAEAYDSPALVARRTREEMDGDPRLARRSSRHAALCEWERVSGRPVPPTVAVWLSDYLVDELVALVERLREPVLVWYESKALGERLAAVGGWRLCGPGNPPKGEPETCVVSISAHHHGLNLQGWRLSVVVEPPSSGQKWEQMIGRTHRAGQLADEVHVFTFVGPEPFASAFASAREQAAYQAETTGGRMKLVFAPVIQD